MMLALVTKLAVGSATSVAFPHWAMIAEQRTGRVNEPAPMVIKCEHAQFVIAEDVPLADVTDMSFRDEPTKITARVERSPSQIVIGWERSSYTTLGPQVFKIRYSINLAAENAVRHSSDEMPNMPAVVSQMTEQCTVTKGHSS